MTLCKFELFLSPPPLPSLSNLNGSFTCTLIHVTSFFSFTEENSEYWPQKRTKSGNIYSIILDVRVGRQSAQTYYLTLIDHQSVYIHFSGTNPGEPSARPQAVLHLDN